MQLKKKRWALLLSVGISAVAYLLYLLYLHFHRVVTCPVDQPPTTSIGEDPFLKIILGTPVLSTNYFVANIGASNGKVVARGGANSDVFNSLIAVLNQQGHKALAVEPKKTFEELKKNLPSEFTLKLNQFTTPDTIVDQLREAQAPLDMRVFKIDIDGYDIDVVRAVLGAGFMPSFVSVEINEKIPPPIRFAVRYDKKQPWRYLGDGHCYGASLQSWVDMFSKHKYFLYGLEWNDALFVKQDLADIVKVLYGEIPSSPEEAYEKGYSGRYCRTRYFPWNANVDHWINEVQTGSINKAKAEIEGHMTSYGYVRPAGGTAAYSALDFG